MSKNKQANAGLPVDEHGQTSNVDDSAPVAAPIDTETPTLRGASSGIIMVDEVAFAPAPTVVTAVVPEPAPVPVPTLPDGVELSPVGRACLQELDIYIEAMHPKKPQNPVRGSQQQVRLHRLIQKILNHVEDDFHYVFSQLLAKFDQHGKEDVFDDRHLMRFLDVFPLSIDEAAVFRRMLNLIKQTASIKSRQLVLKQVNLNGAFKGLSPVAVQKLQNFYNV